MLHTLLKSTLLSLLVLTNFEANDTFKPLYSFKNISVNYLNWSDSTQTKTSKEDFAYFEFEGGAGFNWGELYMFADIENPTKSYSDTPQKNLRFVIKPVLDITLIENLSIHLQAFTLDSKDFYVSNMISGFSYNLKNSYGINFKPFFGLHYQKSTYYSGYNGFMGGWTLMYNFEIKEQKFLFSQWHECTLARDTDDGYNNHIGRQGALVFLWNINTELTTGAIYRYASYELGETSYQDGFIYTLKYNF